MVVAILFTGALEMQKKSFILTNFSSRLTSAVKALVCANKILSQAYADAYRLPCRKILDN